MLRWFKRKPKKCNKISISYNPNKPETGLDIWLGEDEEFPGLAKSEVTYHHIEVDDLDWLIEWLQDIKNEFNKPSE